MKEISNPQLIKFSENSLKFSESYCKQKYQQKDSDYYVLSFLTKITQQNVNSIYSTHYIGTSFLNTNKFCDTKIKFVIRISEDISTVEEGIKFVIKANYTVWTVPLVN